MSAGTMIGVFDDFKDAMTAIENGGPGHAYSWTTVAPYVVRERRMSDAEIRCFDAESIARDAYEAFGARFPCMPRRVQSRAIAAAEIAALTSLENRPRDQERAFCKARRAAVQSVNRRRQKHV